MKKILLYISFIFITTSVFAQQKIGSEGNIISTGNYPSVKSKDVKGGVHFFQTITDRNNLPANFRDTGMIAYVFADTTYYTLKHGITNSDWQEWKGGNGGCLVTFYTTPDSIYLVKDSCGSIIDSTMWVGDTSGTSGSSLTFEQSLINQGSTAFTTDPVVDFGGHALEFNNLNGFNIFSNNGGIVGTVETGIGVSSFSSDFNHSSTIIAYREGDSTRITMKSQSPGKSHSLDIYNNKIKFNSSGILNVEMDGIDSSNADPNNIAWFDSDNILHRGGLGATPPVQFQWSVIDSVNSVVSPSQGDIYLVSTSPTGAFAGHSNQIATYDTTDGFSYTTATVGDLLYNATLQKVSKWNGTTWTRIKVDAYVHIDYPEKIIGKKTFTDTLNVENKPLNIINSTGGIKNYFSVTPLGSNIPFTTISGNGSTRSELALGGKNAGWGLLRLVGDYQDTIISGAYRPLRIIANYELELKSAAAGFSDTTITFKNAGGYAGIVHATGKWSFNKYASRAFYQNDTTAWKPMVMDNAGNIGQSSWVGGSGSGITQSQLDDSTAAIRADIGGSSSTPSLQDVTDVGNSTVNNILSSSKIAAPIINATSSLQVGLPIPSSQNSTISASNITFPRSVEMPDADGILPLTVNGVGANNQGDIPLRLKSYTVATLPASPTQGDVAYVTDASSPSYLTTVTGGGSVVCPVFFDGSTWVAH